MNSVDFNSYIEFMEFMSSMIGLDSELVLYDVNKMVVRHVINPMDDEMKPGSEIRSLEKNFILNKLYENQRYIVNYRALSKSQKKLKSGTIFLKNSKDKLEAILTINIPVDNLIELRNMINDIISGPSEIKELSEKEFYDSFEVKVEDMVINTIKEEISKYGVEANRLTPSERIEIIKRLDYKGLFLVKGSIAELANAFETTETTIYRYLSRLK